MLGICHPVKSRHGLSLTSCRDNRDLLRFEFIYFRYIYQRTRRDIHISEIIGGVDYIEHAPSGKGDLPSIGDAVVDNLLHPVDV